MNYGSDPADQIVRFTLEGSEVALRLSGSAAKNFALFVYAVLKDQKKTRGKTRLVRMLKEQRPFKFFKIPQECLSEFAKEAKAHGLLYTAIRNKHQQGQVELVVFADDASKVSRVLDNLNLDFVGTQAGEGTFESTQAKTMQDRSPENFIPGRDRSGRVPAERSPSERSSTNNDLFTGAYGDESKPSVRKQLNELKRNRANTSRQADRTRLVKKEKEK